MPGLRLVIDAASPTLVAIPASPHGTSPRGIDKEAAKPVAVVVILSSLPLGILNVNLYLYREPDAKHIINYVGREKLILKGIICENPELSPDRTELIVAASRLNDDGADARIEGLIFQNTGGFDYVKYLRYKEVMVRGFIKDPAGIVILRENQCNIFKLHLERFRKLEKVHHGKLFLLVYM
ncbi:MAG: hypothetical protein ACLP9S_01915 [Syntrophales bacterium]